MGYGYPNDMKKVTDETLKSLEMDGIHDYFDYIIESIANGNRKQAKDLFYDLSEDDGMKHKGQRSEFFDYIDELYHWDERDEDGRNMGDVLKDYFKNPKLI